MASLVYNEFPFQLLQGTIDLVNDSFKVALVTNAYVPSKTNHRFFSDITSEVVGQGYVAGGADVSLSVVRQDEFNNSKIEGTDVSWLNSTLTARAAILYKDTGVAATSPLIFYLDFLSDKISVDGTFTVQWNADGIASLSQA